MDGKECVVVDVPEFWMIQVLKTIQEFVRTIN